MHSSMMHTARFNVHLYRGCLPEGCTPLDPEADTPRRHPLRHCMLGYTPPLSVNRVTERCKNITLSQTLFAGGKHTLLFEEFEVMSYISFSTTEANIMTSLFYGN